MARLAVEASWVFYDDPWADTDDKVINEQMIEDALTRTDWVSALEPVSPKPRNSQGRGEQVSPTDAQLEYAMGQARTALHNEAAPGWLRHYYKPDGGYAGNTFLSVEPNDPWKITASDLYAISLLNVKADPWAARRLLESPTNQQTMSAALRAIPVDADLATASAKVWGAAEELYRTVKPLLGRNPWVTSSKLCARKRPSFFPVRDRVVTVDRLRLGKNYLTDWAAYKHLIADPEIYSGLTSLMLQLRDDDTQPVSILDPPLKVLDVLLWMSTMARPRSTRRGMSVR